MWAPAFHDHALRKVEDLLQAARYIVMNPARAGLSRRIDDYPYWNCVWLWSDVSRGLVLANASRGHDSRLTLLPTGTNGWGRVRMRTRSVDPGRT